MSLEVAMMPLYVVKSSYDATLSLEVVMMSLYVVKSSNDTTLCR
jgi:hypothetical protein